MFLLNFASVGSNILLTSKNVSIGVDQNDAHVDVFLNMLIVSLNKYSNVAQVHLSRKIRHILVKERTCNKE